MATHSKDSGIFIDIKGADGSTERSGILDAANSITTDLSGNNVDVSQLGDDGIRRLAGRADASFDVEVNLDLGTEAHKDLLKASKSGVYSGSTSNDDPVEVIVNVFPDKENNASTSIKATCNVTSVSVGLPGDSQNTLTVTFENKDGAVWALDSGIDFTKKSAI